jgi:hypothetical protein
MKKIIIGPHLWVCFLLLNQREFIPLNTIRERKFRKHEDSVVLNIIKNMNEQLSTIGINYYHDNDDGGLSFDELGKSHSHVDYCPFCQKNHDPK